jgi:DHA1 family bicyclomycin/chloramphenicol resistance-like MFS transporter
MSLSRSPRFIALLILITALGPLSMQMFLPALPLIQRDFATDTGTAQLALTASMLAIGVATLAYGPLSDRFGRRPVLLAGLALFAAGSAVSALAPTVSILIAGRILQSAGASAGIVLARAMARDVYGPDRALRVVSYLTMAMVMAPMIAPALGGAVADAFGWRAVFQLMIGVGALTLLGVFLGLVETHGRAGEGGWRALAANSRRLIGLRRFWGYALAGALSVAVFFAFLAAAPYLTVETLKLTARDYGFWFMPVAGAFLVGTFVSTRIVGRLGVERTIWIGAAATAVVVAATALLYLAWPLTPALLFAPAIVVSFLQGFVIANAQASAINLEPAAAGAASGLTGFVQMAISAAVAQAVGVLNDGTPWPMMAFMIGAGVLGLAVLPLMRRPKEAPAPA